MENFTRNVETDPEFLGRAVLKRDAKTLLENALHNIKRFKLVRQKRALPRAKT